MNVLSVLKKDQDAIKRLLIRFEEAVGAASHTKIRLFKTIRQELELHFAAKEKYFYPALRGVNPNGRRLVGSALRTRRQIDELILRIARLKVADERFVDQVEALIEDVEHHLEEEDGQIFQFAKENCPQEQLNALGRSYASSLLGR